MRYHVEYFVEANTPEKAIEAGDYAQMRISELPQDSHVQGSIYIRDDEALRVVCEGDAVDESGLPAIETYQAS
jgi:hypothetical protein